jgi:multidrug efflux system membrane fusion protein
MSQPSANDPGPAVHRDLDPHHALPTSTVSDPAHLLPAEGAPPAGKGGSWLRKIIILAVLLGAIAFAVWRVHANNLETADTASKAAAAAGRPTPVLVSPVQQRTVPVYLTALGTVTAYNTVTLHTRVDGQLLKVNFREGQAVNQGQLLLQIDPRPYQAALAQAQGQLSKDVATQKNAAAEAQRYTALYQAGVVSKESQQTQISNEGQASGSIEADNAAIQAAKVNLSYTSIYSPINGVVGLRGVDPGNIVHASDSTGLVVITQIHPIAVIFTLPEDQLPQVQQAMRGAKLAVDAYDRNDAHKIASGTLLTIDNQIDTTTGTAKLKAVFDNADNSLFPNQFVNVRLILRERQNAIVVPTAAVQSGTQGTFVFVVHPGAGTAGAGAGGRHSGGGGNAGGGAGGSGGAPQAGPAPAGAAPGSNASAGDGGQAANAPRFHVDSVPVHVDFAQGSNSILADGALKAGDQLVIDGQERLTPGSNVVPQQAPPAAAPGGRGIGASGAVPPSTQTQPAGTDNGTPSQRRRQGANAGAPPAQSTGGGNPQ